RQRPTVDGQRPTVNGQRSTLNGIAQRHRYRPTVTARPRRAQRGSEPQTQPVLSSRSRVPVTGELVEVAVIEDLELPLSRRAIAHDAAVDADGAVDIASRRMERAVGVELTRRELAL